jgi:hypothetical protein
MKPHQTLLSPAFGSQNYPPATLYTRTGSFLFSSFPPNASLPSSCEIPTTAPSAVSPVVAPTPGSARLRRPPLHLPLPALISPAAAALCFVASTDGGRHPLHTRSAGYGELRRSREPRASLAFHGRALLSPVVISGCGVRDPLRRVRAGVAPAPTV